MGEDKRGKHTPSKETPEEDLHHVRGHIESFPITESHYTRKDTKRKYLDQKLSIAKMYALYLDHCKNHDPPLKPVGEITYRRIFCKEYNLSFYHPKKDQCSKRAHYANLNTAEKENFKDQHDLHLRRNKDAQELKQKGKWRAIEDSSFVAATFDLQSVLQVPSTDASLTHYSRSYACTT